MPYNARIVFTPALPLDEHAASTAYSPFPLGPVTVDVSLASTKTQPLCVSFASSGFVRAHTGWVTCTSKTLSRPLSFRTANTRQAQGQAKDTLSSYLPASGAYGPSSANAFKNVDCFRANAPVALTSATALAADSLERSSEGMARESRCDAPLLFSSCCAVSSRQLAVTRKMCYISMVSFVHARAFYMRCAGGAVGASPALLDIVVVILSNPLDTPCPIFAVTLCFSLNSLAALADVFTADAALLVIP